MLKKITSPLILGICIILLFISIIFLFYLKKNEIVYVDNSSLFNEFRMTKELIKTGEIELNARKRAVDSIYQVLKAMDNQNEKSRLTREIIELQQQIENFQSNYSATNVETIWKRINSYTKDFSKEMGYDLIIGSQTNGVFQGNPDLDKTNELLTYINRRYEGFK